MKRLLLLSFFIILYPSLSFSSEIQFFNTLVLGQDISSEIHTLETSDNNSGLIHPKIVQLDIDGGHYSASSVYYDSSKVSFDELVKQIDQKYPGTKVLKLSSDTYSRWRVKDKQFVIYLDSDEVEGMLRVIYIRFIKTEKVLEHVLDTLNKMNRKNED